MVWLDQALSSGCVDVKNLFVVHLDWKIYNKMQVVANWQKEIKHIHF